MDRAKEFLQSLQTYEWLQEKFAENPEKTLASLGLTLLEAEVLHSTNYFCQYCDSAK